nr:hypothetical protein [Tanacetum cinerariifolium]
MDLLQNLLDTRTTLTRRVEILEHDKVAQALEITKLKQRVKKLERRNKASKLQRLKKVGTTQRIKTFDDTVMGDVYKQGRMIADMDADVDVILEDAKEVDVEKSANADESADVQGRQAKKPQTKAQARKNMMIYLRNVAGFKMDYFKGMTYDDVRLIYKKKFNSNVAFLMKKKEQMDAEDSRALKRLKVKNASTPMETQEPLLKDEDGEEVDVHIYRLMIGSLMYLTSLRPDIMFVVYACARYHVNPKVSHLHVVKRIFRRDLRLADEDGVDCLPNSTIFENLELMRTVIKLKNKKRSRTYKLNRLYKDDVQAKIDPDYQLAERLQAKEQQELADEEKATLFLDEGSSKIAGEDLTQERLKKQKVDDEKEIAKLKKLMEIIPNEEEVAIDAISLTGRIVRIKSHLNAVGITPAHIDVNIALVKLVLLVNFKKNILCSYYCWYKS